MAGKGKFLYIFPSGDGYRALVKASDFSGYPKGTTFTLEHGVGLPLSKMSTNDLFKVKAQIATELENRMDLDEVTEANLDNLKSMIKDASAEVIAQLIRQTLDRIDVVGSDEKRAKTRLQILEDELRSRMITDGVSEMKFKDLIHASYKGEMVFSVGEEGWDTVYSGIVADTLAAQFETKSELNTIVSNVDLKEQLEELSDVAVSKFENVIDVMRGRLRREKDIYDKDITEALKMLDDLQAELTADKLEMDEDYFKKSIVEAVGDVLVDNVRGGIANIDAFSILQKRLTSTTLNELVKQGEELPKGIQSQTIHKLKIKRTK